MKKCEHGRQKSRCNDCGGTSFCEHGRQKSQCKECGGTSFCEHVRQKHTCKQCDGASICEHDRQKSQCKQCKGASICEHDRPKYTCKECGGSALCRSEWCAKRAIPKYNYYCLTCVIHIHPEIEVSRNYKTKENDVVQRIMEKFPDFTWVADKKIQDGCSLRRPDLLVDLGSHLVIIEVDENKHSEYDCSCEHKRLMELSRDLQHRPIVFIRFNPDAYKDQDGVLIKSCWRLNKLGIMTIPKKKEKEWDQRIEALIGQIQYWICTPVEKTIEIVELFY